MLQLRKAKGSESSWTLQNRGPLFHQLLWKLESWLANELLNGLLIRHNSFPLRKAALLTGLLDRIDDEFRQDRLDVSLSHFCNVRIRATWPYKHRPRYNKEHQRSMVLCQFHIEPSQSGQNLV